MRTEVSRANGLNYRGKKNGWAGRLIAPFFSAWQYRELIRAIVSRDLYKRYRESYFGWAWAVLAPLAMLSVYTLVFSVVLKIGMKEGESVSSYSLTIFVGLIVFNLCAELMHRAPLLLVEHAHVIKKSIFPSEILAWTALVRSLVSAGIGLLVFFAFEVLLTGSLPVTVLLFPLFFVPLCMFALGSIWFLAALGAFTRDVAFLMITFVPLLIFASPVFYAISDFPVNVRFVFYLNPLTPFIEMARDILLVGAVPHPLTYLVACAIAVVMFYGGYSFFMRYRSVVVDVL